MVRVAWRSKFEFDHTCTDLRDIIDCVFPPLAGYYWLILLLLLLLTIIINVITPRWHSYTGLFSTFSIIRATFPTCNSRHGLYSLWHDYVVFDQWSSIIATAHYLKAILVGLQLMAIDTDNMRVLIIGARVFKDKEHARRWNCVFSANIIMALKDADNYIWVARYPNVWWGD